MTAPRVNDFGQPIGAALPAWEPRDRPTPTTLAGRFVRLEPVSADHVSALADCLARPEDAHLWTYRSDDQPTSVEEMARFVARLASATGWTSYAVVPTATGLARGLTSLLRDEPGHGSIEVGGVLHAEEIQRTPVTTEAASLLARHVFDDLGYRRLEWKLDSLNAPSAAAARRLGFTEEGLFRQHQVYKGRNRDTLWFAMTDTDWPAIREAHDAWLAPENFDEQGRQRQRLQAPGR